jgi:hypothetical protein
LKTLGLCGGKSFVEAKEMHSRIRATTWVVADGDNGRVPLLCCSNEEISRSQDDALQDILSGAYEGDGLFYICATDGWFFVSGDEEETSVSLISSTDNAVIVEFIVNFEWSKIAIDACHFIWINIHDETPHLKLTSLSLEALSALYGGSIDILSVACVASGKVPE